MVLNTLHLFYKNLQEATKYLSYYNIYSFYIFNFLIKNVDSLNLNLSLLKVAQARKIVL